nr:A24 family peptidase [Methylomarinovum caldicuralii]
MRRLMLALLQQVPALFYGAVFVLGLLVGSFLNVVIHRLPVMLERRWRQECRAFLGLQEEPVTERFDLVRPASHCPHCGHPIRAWENIPLLSWLLLRGRCSQCRAPISLRYPVVELLTALVSLAVAWRFGVSFQTLWGLVLTWSLVALSAIDIDHQLLPDAITLPLLWLGLLLNVAGLFTDLRSGVIGAAAGYLVLWSVYQVFRLLTGKEGMGYGDFKLLAVFGAWLGWQMLPLIILISSLVGAIAGIALILLQGRDRGQPIPFGPYLAVAGWIALLWGRELTQWYLHLTGIA